MNRNYGKIVLDALLQRPITTWAMMRLIPGGGTILRPGAVVEDLRYTHHIDVKMTPVGKSRMALYYLTAAEKKRVRKLPIGRESVAK